MALGILLLIVGTLAIIYDFMATLVSVFFFGWILIFMGAFEAMTSLWQTKWGGLFLQLAMGILAVVVGFHFVASPVASALVLTLLVAVYLMVIGILMTVAAPSGLFPKMLPKGVCSNKTRFTL